MIRRLILFASYDRDGLAGPSLLYFLKSLDALGDVVFVSDASMDESEKDKLRPYCIHVQAEHHGEYDFGSYKRGLEYALANLEPESYDYLYLVNDSVFGPLANLAETFCKMEALDKAAFSLVLNPHRRHPHMQSWFIGLRQEVFLSDWFISFLRSVSVQDSKEDICVKYETGLTELMESKGIVYDAAYKLSGRQIYNSVKKIWKMGIPFIKKSSFTRHNGSLGNQIAYVLGQAGPAAGPVLADAERLFGEEYTRKLLSCGILASAGRYLAYLLSKVGLLRIS